MGNGPKISQNWVVFNLPVNFDRICSIMKIYIIYCVPIQILYWKDLVPEIQTKVLSANQTVGFFNQFSRTN